MIVENVFQQLTMVALCVNDKYIYVEKDPKLSFFAFFSSWDGSNGLMLHIMKVQIVLWIWPMLSFMFRINRYAQLV